MIKRNWTRVDVSPCRASILREIDVERDRQDAKHGAQRETPILLPEDCVMIDHDGVFKRIYERRSTAGTVSHVLYTLEEMAEVVHATSLAELREESIQTAACLVKMIEAIDWQAKRKDEP